MKARVVLTAIGLLAFSALATAQITPSSESLLELYPGKGYSPYALRSFPS